MADGMDDAEALIVAALFTSTSAAEGRSVGLAVLTPRSRVRTLAVAATASAATASVVNWRKDSRTHTLQLYQFMDSERYVNVEAVLVQFTQAESANTSATHVHVYIADCGASTGEMTKLESACQSAEATYEKAPRSWFPDATGDTLSSLTKLSGDAVPYETDQRKLALRAAACVVQKGKLEEAAAEATAAATEGAAAAGNILEVRLSDLSSFARLDAAAVRALNIFSTARDAAIAQAAVTDASAAGSTAAVNNTLTSIHAVVSYGCKTKGGKRLMRQWLLQPLVDLEAITARQTLVELFVTSSTLRKSWRESTNMPDLEALAARMHRKSATLQDLLRLYGFALQLPALSKRMATVDEDADPEAMRLLSHVFLNELDVAAKEFGKYMELVEKLVDEPGSHEPRISPTWNPELGELAEERQALLTSIMDVWNAAKSSGGWAAELGEDVKCERDRVRGYVFRTRKTAEKAVRAIPNVHIAAVLKDGLYFTTTGTKGLKRLADRLLEVEAEYDSKSREVFLYALDIARSYTPLLEHTAAIIAELDAIASLAHVAVSSPGHYVKPTLTASGTGDTVIREGRHPVMEYVDSDPFIPNDYTLEREGGRFIIITGPNMGGKSTFIRTLGCIVLLAQIGSFVPASAARISIVDMICARIGAGDRALRGVSTFMAEMLEASSILSAATERSLVIIDELGRGTSTYDGFGLAWSISEHLACKTKCFTLFATHFHELTALAACVPVVRNKHVTAHTSSGSITMLYNVRDGACPTSFGIHVAEMAGFPKSVIAAARAKAATLESTAGHAASTAMLRGAGEVVLLAGGRAPAASPGAALPLQTDVPMLDTFATPRKADVRSDVQRARALAAALKENAQELLKLSPADRRARVAAIAADLDEERMVLDDTGSGALPSQVADVPMEEE